MKRFTPLIVFVMLAAGCSDSDLMEELGDRSHEYVVGSTTTLAFSDVVDTTAPGPGAIPIEEVRWFNEAIDGETISEPSIVVSTVWARGGAEGRFIQASPAEINIAVPSLEFPALVPEGSAWITSQLVFDPASATLDPATSAAFGLWSVPPYTDDAGRVAVLRVGVASGASSAAISSAPTENGLNLVWSSGSYRYDLLCYPDVSDAVCWQMAEVMAPLASVAPEPILESG